MTKSKLALWVLACFLFLTGQALAEVNAEAAASAPQQFYQAVNVKDYGTAWNLLTSASKARITSMVAADAKLPEEQVRQLFDTNDASVQGGFWDSLRGGADTEVYAGLKYVYAGEKNGALIVNASDPAGGDKSLEMIVKDEGGYKFGLIETYGI